MTGTTQAMRMLHLQDKENVHAAAGTKSQQGAATDQLQVIKANQHEQSTPGAGTSVHAGPDPCEVVDALMGVSVGCLMGGDDLFTAEFDRVSGTGLDILYRLPVHRLPPEELAVEKQAIKRRLRSFDNHVAACSGRKATKEDKRHLRPLYLRLAHVKRQMHVLETTGAGMGQMPGYRAAAAQGGSHGGSGHGQRTRAMGVR